MKQVTFLGTEDERSAGHTITSGFSWPLAKAMRKAARAPVVIHGVLVPDSRVQWRPLSAGVGMQSRPTKQHGCQVPTMVLLGTRSP